MQVLVSPLESREDWLQKRRKYIGASEVASLFEEELSAIGEKPYLSYFRLWHEKAGLLEPENLDSNKSVKAGRFLEKGLIDWLAHETGCQVSAAQEHFTNDKLRLACTPDAYILLPEKGKGIAEFKVISAAQYRALEGEPPLKYELQLQQNMGLAGASWGCFGFLVTSEFGQKLVPIFRDYRASVFEKISKAATKFWDSIKTGNSPKPDFLEDSADVCALYDADNGETIDLTGDNRINILAIKYQQASEAKARAEKERQAAKAEILEKIGAHAVCIFNGGTITAKTVNRKGYAVEDSSFRDFRLKLKEDKTNE